MSVGPDEHNALSEVQRFTVITIYFHALLDIIIFWILETT